MTSSAQLEWATFTAVPSPEAKELTQTLRSELLQLSTKSIALSHALGQLDLRFFHHPNHYLVMASSSSDPTMMRLGRLPAAIPRGLPIVWVPGRFLRVFGFLPKFENGTPDPSDTLEATLKWSGFLSQLLVYTIPDCSTVYWSTPTKTSALGSFAADARRVWNPSPALLVDLLHSNTHLCAEILSKKDQSHGYAVLQEAAVVTVAGIGFAEYYDGSIINNSLPNALVEFLDYSSLIDLAEKHNLSIGLHVSITSSVAQRDFIAALDSVKDTTTLPIVYETIDQIILEYPDSVTVYPGTVKHEHLVGDILEGLVLRTASSLVKYKYPAYTCRTMVLRRVASSLTKTQLTEAMLQDIDSFTSRSCSTTYGSALWRASLQKALLYLSSATFPDSPIGLHIQAMDRVFTKHGVDISPSTAQCINAQFVEQLSSQPVQGTVILVLGPIGSGKSTFSSHLCSMLPNSIHIDGDRLDLGHDVVSQLGGERNQYTRWMIYRALSEGKVPILSTGGGAVAGAHKCFLPEELQRMFGGHFRVILCVSSIFRSSVARISGPLIDDAFNSYNPKYNVTRNAVKYRLKTGDPHWSLGKSQNLTQFLDMIAKKSAQNRTFANAIHKIAYTSFTFPVITHADFSDNTISSLPDVSIITNEVQAPSTPLHPRCRQLRALVRILDSPELTRLQHMTMEHHENGFIYNSQEFNSKVLQFLGEYPGKLVTLVDPNNRPLKRPKKQGIQLVVVSGLEPTAHVTIRCAQHRPALMAHVCKELKAGNKLVQLPKTNSSEVVSYQTDLPLSHHPSVRVEVVAIFPLL